MFDKKPKTEKANDPLTRFKHKTGKFVLNEKNEVVLREIVVTETYNQITHEWQEEKPETKDTPIEKLGWTKKLEDYIVLKKVVPSRETYKGFDTLLFLKKITYEIRDDKPYIYLTRSGNKQSRKIVLRNFDTGVTGFVPTNSNDVVKVIEHPEKPISKAEVLEMYKKGLITEVYDSEETVNGEKVFKKQVFA